MKLIKSKRHYTHNGEEKTKWMVVGEIFEANGKEYVRLNINPNDVYHVFDFEDRDRDINE